MHFCLDALKGYGEQKKIDKPGPDMFGFSDPKILKLIQVWWHSFYVIFLKVFPSACICLTYPSLCICLTYPTPIPAPIYKVLCPLNLEGIDIRNWYKKTKKIELGVTGEEPLLLGLRTAQGR